MNRVVTETGFLRRRRHPAPTPRPNPAPAAMQARPGAAPERRPEPSSAPPVARPVTAARSLSPAPPAPSGASLLSLDDGPPDSQVADQRQLHVHAPAARPNVLSTLPGLRAGEQVSLDPVQHPVVVAGRLLSGVGALHLSLAKGGSQGVSLGCVYEDEHGVDRVAVAGAASPPDGLVLHAATGDIIVNLRQVRRLSRFLIFATRTLCAPWQGVTIGELAGATSITVPLASEAVSTIRALLSGHTVDGQLVLRAEGDHLDGPLQALCENHGYELTWVTPDTPLAHP